MLRLTALVACALAGAASRAVTDEDVQAWAVGKQHREKNDSDLNLRPLIGVLSQPGDPAPKGFSYIAASYVRFVQMAGGRVVPIEYDLPYDQVRERFNAVNGILIPGGSADLKPGHPFYDITDYIFKLALSANDRGDYFPIQGTCLGFEMLSVIASGNTSLLRKFDAEDYASALFMTEDGESSRFFGSMPKKVVRNLQTKPLAMENHANGVYFRSWGENKALRDFAKVLSLSTDRDERVYVSTWEAHKYPIYATQYHPEKAIYEWAAPLHIPHSPAAIEATTAIASFFVGEARKNHHAPDNQLQEDAMLIYNWAPEFTGSHRHAGEERDFDEIYLFKEWDGERRLQVPDNDAPDLLLQ